MKRTKRKAAVRKIGKGMIYIGGWLILLFGVSGISAYFTDTDASTNTFTVGKVTIEHHEDEWDDLPPEEKEDVTPNKEIPKDPSIVNTGNNGAFVFQTVEVPCADVITANPDGTKNPKRLTDLFSYTVKSGWTLINTEDVKAGAAVTAHKYTYVYGTAEKCTELVAGAETPTLFDSVTVANLVEGQDLEETTQNIVINAYGIQASDLGEHDTTAPSEVLSIIYNQMK